MYHSLCKGKLRRTLEYCEAKINMAINLIKKVLHNPYKIFSGCSNFRIFRLLPDKTFLKLKFRGVVGYKLNLDNPVTFCEKQQWLKLYDRKPIYTTMVDKCEAKKYAASIIGEEYIIPTLGVWDHFEEINFDSMPNQFVLKCTHDSGGLVICRDKRTFNKKTARRKIKKCLKNNYYWVGREWPYKNVKPRIIAEQYMEDSLTHELRDYKIFIFDGVAKALSIATDRQKQGEDAKFDFYDAQFVHLPLTNGHPDASPTPTRPEAFDEMKALTEKLSQKIPCLRVDFYDINKMIYFGELTFSHWSGLVPFDPEKWDKTFGSWIKLPEKLGGGYISINENGWILWIHQDRSSNKSENAVKNAGLTDIKFYCFHGEPKFLYVSTGLENHKTARMDFLNTNWTLTNFGRTDYKHYDTLPKKPDTFDEMLKYAKLLSKGINFIRIDFYDIDGHLYFGEFTFSPNGGFVVFEPRKADTEIGEFLHIRTENN